jgi:hypothetical protein
LPEPLRTLFPDAINTEPWRIVEAAQHMVQHIRLMGSFNLVDVQTPDAKVYIRML